MKLEFCGDLALDVRVELWSYNFAIFADADETVIGEPILVDWIQSGVYACGGFGQYGDWNSHLDCYYDDGSFLFILWDATRRAGGIVAGALHDDADLSRLPVALCFL